MARQDRYSGERSNEFGGEGRYDRRQQFVEKFDRWRSERAARTADRGPVSASAGSSRRETGRSAKK